MIIQTLNIGLPQKENFGGKEVTTGLCKKPVSGASTLTQTGFVGDGVQDRKHHGGEDKAVCAYSVDHYPYWQELLGHALPPAPFGENLAISGLTEEEIAIGDIVTAGTAVLQVSQPRQPCKTLAARFERNDFVKLVVDAGFTGFYFRVLTEGAVRAGDELRIVEQDPGKVSVAFANRIFHHDRRNRAGLEQILAVDALSSSWRESFTELLAKCG